MSNQDPKLLCDLCGVKFSHRKSVYQHKRKMHNLTVTVPGNFICDICSATFHSRKTLVNHISMEHQDFDHIDTYFFTAQSDFDEWKKEIERNTKSLYVIQNCYTVNKVDKRTILRCNRFGHYVPRGRGKRELKYQGSCKAGRTCTAQIMVTRHPDGNITVLHYSTHRGHNDLYFVTRGDDVNDIQEKDTTPHIRDREDSSLIDNIIINENVNTNSEATEGPTECLNFILANEALSNCEAQIICPPDLIDSSSTIDESVSTFTNDQDIIPSQSEVINKTQYLLQLLQDVYLNDYTLSDVDKYLDDAIAIVQSSQKKFTQNLLLKKNSEIINSVDDNVLDCVKRKRTI